MENGKAIEPSTVAHPGTESEARGWWLITVLTLLYTLAFLDRQIITLMVDPIRESLNISEVQVGLLQGFSFALFYAVAGIPLGIAADRLSRRKLIFWGAIAWTIAASASGLARNYWMLLTTRIGVGVAEASLLPAGYSLIASTFPQRRLGLAISIFSSGSIVGGAAASFLGAAILASLPASGVTVPVLGLLEPWQAAFILAAVPCLLVAPLIFTVPDRRVTVPRQADGGFGPAIAEMRRHKGFYGGHFLGFGVCSFCGYATTSWAPTYLMREFGLSVLTVGSWFAILGATFGLVGVLAIGWLADRWFAAGRRDAHVITPMVVFILQTVTLVGAMLADSAGLCIAFLALYFLFVGFHGSAAAALQIATPPALRGRISALYLFTFIVMGAGAGPFATAAINQWIMPDTSQLHISIMLATAFVFPIGIGCLLLAARGLRRIEAERSQPET